MEPLALVAPLLVGAGLGAGATVLLLRRGGGGASRSAEPRAQGGAGQASGRNPAAAPAPPSTDSTQPVLRAQYPVGAAAPTAAGVRPPGGGHATVPLGGNATPHDHGPLHGHGGHGGGDEGVIGEATVAQSFVPDFSAQAIPGLTEVYKRIQSGQIQGYLVVVAGPDRGAGAALAGQAVTVGRASDNVLRLNDPGASNHQCAIALQAGRCFVSDQHSTNGTFVNNQRITAGELSNCDVLAFGSTKILVTLGG